MIHFILLLNTFLDFTRGSTRSSSPLLFPQEWRGSRAREVNVGTFFRALLVFLLLLPPCTQAIPATAAEDPLQGPWDSPAYRSFAERQKTTSKSSSVASTFFTSLLTFFVKVISPVDGDRCPSYPTCAAYSKEAYQKHGALLGTLMTVDRLIHEADERRFSPTIEVYGINRIYDPVSANEVWNRQARH